MAVDTDLRARADRLDVVLREFDARSDESAKTAMHEIVGLLLDLHREGLARIVTLAGDSSLGGPALVSRLADDALVGPLLLIHAAHPYPMETRLARALDRLRPRLAAHGCRATLAGVEDGEARVRLDGGDRLSGRSDLPGLIRTALLDAAPELAEVSVDGAAIPDTPALIQILTTAPPAPQGERRS